MSARKTLSLFILFLFVFAWAACGDGSKKTVVPALASISITASSTAPAAGLTSQLTVTGTYTDGKTRPIGGAVWSTSNAAVATVDANGLVTARTAGTAVITGAYGVINSSITITVGPAVLASLSISPTTVSVVHGHTHTFTVTGTMTDGSPAPPVTTLAWASADPAVATVSEGTITTHSVGTTTINVHCTVTGKATSATLTVTPPLVVRIRITPELQSIEEGTQQQFVAMATYTDSSTKDVTATAIWETSAPQFASIDASVAGLFHGVAKGTTIVTAKLESETGYAQLTVTPRTLSYLYALGAYTAVEDGYFLMGFKVLSDGTLSEWLANSFYDVNLPMSRKMATDGKFIFIDADYHTSIVRAFRINHETGGLSLTATTPIGLARVSHITVDPTGKWAFGFDETDARNARIRVYSVDAATGALSGRGYSYVYGDWFRWPESQYATAFITNSSGTYFYFGGQGQSGCTESHGGSIPCTNLFGYRLDMETGALTALPGSPFDSWSSWISTITVSPDKSTMWVSIDETRIVTYSIDPLTGALTQIDRWSPLGYGYPLAHTTLYKDYLFGGQMENTSSLLRVKPQMDYRITGSPTFNYPMEYRVLDIATSPNNSLLVTAGDHGIVVFKVDANGNLVQTSQFNLIGIEQIFLFDKYVPN